jgi:hypothetical protein
MRADIRYLRQHTPQTRNIEHHYQKNSAKGHRNFNLAHVATGFRMNCAPDHAYRIIENTLRKVIVGSWSAPDSMSHESADAPEVARKRTKTPTTFLSRYMNP